MDMNDKRQEELDLIRSSLLPHESLAVEYTTHSRGHAGPSKPPAVCTISSTKSLYFLCWTMGIPEEKPTFLVKGSHMGRDEALGWTEWVGELMESEWDEGVSTGYPIYYMVTTHFLPVLQPHPSPPPEIEASDPNFRPIYRPAHILFTSHHLLAPSKRRDLSSLSSSLRLQGFCKVGYPGMIYAQGDWDDLEEFGKEVRSWQWLALKLRVLEEHEGQEGGEKGDDKRKGRWEEVGSVREAGELLRAVGQGDLMEVCGFGGGGKGG